MELKLNGNGYEKRDVADSRFDIVNSGKSQLTIEDATVFLSWAVDGDKIKAMLHGEISEHVWEQSAGKDVTIYQEDANGYRSNFLVFPDISWDETVWTNKAVADFYGMHSIKSIGKQ